MTDSTVRRISAQLIPAGGSVGGFGPGRPGELRRDWAQRGVRLLGVHSSDLDQRRHDSATSLADAAAGDRFTSSADRHVPEAGAKVVAVHAVKIGEREYGVPGCFCVQFRVLPDHTPSSRGSRSRSGNCRFGRLVPRIDEVGKGNHGSCGAEHQGKGQQRAPDRTASFASHAYLLGCDESGRGVIAARRS